MLCVVFRCSTCVACCVQMFYVCCVLCSDVLRVLRVVCSVLKTFIYDPLVEWSKAGRSAAKTSSESDETRNEKVRFCFLSFY